MKEEKKVVNCEQDLFSQRLNEDNIKRLVPLLIVVALFIMFQAILYIMGDKEEYKDLIVIKVITVASMLFILLVIKKVKKDSDFFMNHSDKLMFSITLYMVLLSVVNTLFAQHISSDISIYIIVLFVIIAGVRMRSSSMAAVLIINYMVFTMFMPLFQVKYDYLIAHIINGGIINVLAFLMSTMFYKYSQGDYHDKQRINRKNKELKILSERDGLTGLYNKRTINELLELYICEHKQSDKSLYLGILDLDHFKSVNDRHGHNYGDEVLKKVATKILENIRPIDIAGRYGGDEFLIVFREVERHEIEKIMKRLLVEVNALTFKECTLSFSCGVAKWSGENLEELFERADRYMYDIKAAGKNNIKIQHMEVEEHGEVIV